MHKVPVAWIYLTGWMMRDGTIQFRDDVYQQDNQPESAAAEGAALAATPRASGASEAAKQLKQASNLDNM